MDCIDDVIYAIEQDECEQATVVDVVASLVESVSQEHYVEQT